LVRSTFQLAVPCVARVRINPLPTTAPRVIGAAILLLLLAIVIGWIVVRVAEFEVPGRAAPDVSWAGDEGFWESGADVPPADTLRLWVRPHRLVPNDSRMDVLFTLSTPKGFMQHVWDDQKQRFVMERVQSQGPNVAPACRLGSDYREQQLKIQAIGMGSVAVPLSEFDGGDAAKVEATGVLGIPLLEAQPQLYPVDWYHLQARFRVSLPGSLVFVDSRACLEGPVAAVGARQQSLTFDMKGVMEPGMDGIRIKPTRDSGAFTGRDVEHGLDLRLTRDEQRIWYLEAFSVGPAIVAVALLVTLLLVSREPVPRRRDSQLTLVVSLAAVLLAVLPLRAVLVPQELPFFTRTDASLSVAAALIALGLLAGAVLLWIDLLKARAGRARG
jgi:hypothetical protein